MQSEVAARMWRWRAPQGHAGVGRACVAKAPGMLRERGEVKQVRGAPKVDDEVAEVRCPEQEPSHIICKNCKAATGPSLPLRCRAPCPKAEQCRRRTTTACTLPAEGKRKTGKKSKEKGRKETECSQGTRPCNDVGVDGS